jgi:Bacterial PH domain
MREFRPPARPSVVRSIFAGAMGVFLLGLVVVMTLLASGTNEIRYSIASGTLTVDSGSRMDGRRVVPLGLVHDRSVVTLRGARRTRGTATPGYCTGRWSYDDLGEVWQATSCAGRGVLIHASDGDLPLLITPPDPDAFLDAMDRRQDVRITLPAGDTTVLRLIPVGITILGLLVGGMAIATILLGPRRMVYRVGEGRLEAATIFGHRSWPLLEMNARPHRPRVTLRIAGTAINGYYTGLFTSDGVRTRVYATDLTAGVLVEGPGLRVFLSPERRQDFLDALRAAGATVGEARTG